MKIPEKISIQLLKTLDYWVKKLSTPNLRRRCFYVQIHIVENVVSIKKRVLNHI